MILSDDGIGYVARMEISVICMLARPLPANDRPRTKTSHPAKCSEASRKRPASNFEERQTLSFIQITIIIVYTC